MLQKLIALTAAVAVVAWPVPPAPPKTVSVTTDYFGRKLTDPYRYFEKLSDPAVKQYFRRQADYTNAVLAKLGPQREAIRADVKRLAQAGSSVSTVNLVGTRLFYLERPPGANNARLMVSEAGATRVLLDPDALAKSTGSKAHLSLSNVLPSPDGTHVAVGIVPGGAEAQTDTRIVDVATGKLSTEHFPRTWFGASAWTQDGTAIYYNQLPKLRPGQSQ
ncbi:MAG: hypothetical protein JO140_03100, partial [Candidatus Eremiobacteraeota bacterium]|nr:hypothetical protein [Candidatus Eremiobacteraeota bacterium]